MGQSNQQIEKGKLRKYITKKEKKEVKKLQRRKKRRENKNLGNPNPKYNRYAGWVL